MNIQLYRVIAKCADDTYITDHILEDEAERTARRLTLYGWSVTRETIMQPLEGPLGA